MANFTQKAIKETFIELLEERPLSDITVKELVEKCEINRNTFYYHYESIPALIEEIVKEDAEKIISEFQTVSSIAECLDAIIRFASFRKNVIMHIYRSVSREVFERHLMIVCEYFVNNYSYTVFPEGSIEENDRKTISDYYKCVCFGLVLNWLNNGMKDDYAHEIRRIFLLKKDWAEEFAQLLQEQI